MAESGRARRDTYFRSKQIIEHDNTLARLPGLADNTWRCLSFKGPRPLPNYLWRKIAHDPSVIPTRLRLSHAAATCYDAQEAWLMNGIYSNICVKSRGLRGRGEMDASQRPTQQGRLSAEWRIRRIFSVIICTPFSISRRINLHSGPSPSGFVCYQRDDSAVLLVKKKKNIW